ncbi:hypothetical protein MMC07_004564 [Pseudocyphellaria aurata]|nr:hypothetical protein [Pseudocyphellaria aurata]
MRYLILQIAWLALGGSWPMLETEHELHLKIARDSQPVGSSTTNSSALTPQTITLSKKVNGSLALSMFLLIVVTWWFLMSYTTKLSNEIALPSKFLEINVAAVLSQTWQKNFESLNVDFSSKPWALFRIEKPYLHHIPGYPFEKPLCRVLGFCDFEKPYFGHEPEKSFIVLVGAFSPVMKSLVQIAIWNSVSFWLVLVVFVNTLIYNGFATKNVVDDSKIRLIFVGVYAVANFGYQCRTTILLYHSFTYVLFQTCWTIICRGFVFLIYLRFSRIERIPATSANGTNLFRDVAGDAYENLSWTTFNFELFGATERSISYQLHNLSRDENGLWKPADDTWRKSCLEPRDKTESKFDKLVKPLLEAEIKTYEKAADSVLEKALANVAVLLGICLATALAPWTSQTINAGNVQLGSYALLLSISTGLLALVGGLTQLTNATESARRILLLQELTIEHGCSAIEREDAPQSYLLDREPEVGFSRKDSLRQSPLTAFGLWKSMSLLHKFFGLIFGPTLMLIPRIHGDSNNSTVRKPWTRFKVKVKGGSFVCDTISPWFEKLRDEETRQAQPGLVER